MIFRLYRIQADHLLRSSTLHLFVAIASVGILAGCSKDSISVTKVPKERVNTAYQIPDHWTLKPASGMRAASFSIRDDHGHDGEVSVLPMPRLNIADIEIVNLWRQQVGLEPATADQVTDLAKTVKIGNEEGNLFDLASPDAANDPDHAARIVTAYLHSEEITWFFKLTGPSHFVEVEKPAFTQFLATVNLAKMQREFQSRSAAQRPASAPSAPARELPQWTVPEGWQPGTPSSQMLLASFSITAQTDGPAEVTVSSLGRGGGGLLPNINRWRGQIGLSTLSQDDLATVIQTIDFNGIEGTLVDMNGPDTRIVAAIVTVGAQTWFYKMMGASGTIETQIEAFTAFVQSVRYSGNG
jgi:hypothetical protein